MLSPALRLEARELPARPGPRRALALLAIGTQILLATSAAAGDLTPVAQTRSLDFSWSSASGTYFCLPPPTGCAPVDVVEDGDQGNDMATDFSAFSSSLGGRVQMDSSELGRHGFTASASHAGDGGASYYETGEPFEIFGTIQTAQSSATLSYTFTVDEPTPYLLSGEVETSGAGILGFMLARIRLVGPGAEEIVDVELQGDPECFETACSELGPEPVYVQGTLAPGTHTVEATLQGTADAIVSIGAGVAAGNSYDGAFQIALTTAVPTPGPGLLSLALIASALGLTGRALSDGRH